MTDLKKKKKNGRETLLIQVTRLAVKRGHLLKSYHRLGKHFKIFYDLYSETKSEQLTNLCIADPDMDFLKYRIITES